MLPLIQANLISAALKAMQRAEQNSGADASQKDDKPRSTLAEGGASGTQIYRADPSRSRVTVAPQCGEGVGNYLNCLL